MWKQASRFRKVLATGFLAITTGALLGAVVAMWQDDFGQTMWTNLLIGSSLGATAVVGIISIANVWPNKREEIVRITEDGVERIYGDISEKIRWEDLVEVGIVTTSGGPFVEDFFWLLMSHDGTGCVVPGEHAEGLLKILQRLPGFDNIAVIEASTCTDDASFTAWRGERGALGPRVALDEKSYVAGEYSPLDDLLFGSAAVGFNVDEE